MDLKKVGFHVITLQKYRKLSNLSPTYETSLIQLLRDINKDEFRKLIIVTGLDEFLEISKDDVITETRMSLNKIIPPMLERDISIVFVVKNDIDNIPDKPSISGKPLSMIMPRPHDLPSLKPGYLYYPIM